MASGFERNKISPNIQASYRRQNIPEDMWPAIEGFRNSLTRQVQQRRARKGTQPRNIQPSAVTIGRAFRDCDEDLNLLKAAIDDTQKRLDEDPMLHPGNTLAAITRRNRLARQPNATFWNDELDRIVSDEE